MAQRLDVIDVSHWQNGIDFAQVKASGVLGVILKATEGRTNVDDMFLKNRDACVTVGLPYCTYHYLHKDNIIEQIIHYLDTVYPTVGERMCIDLEEAGTTLEDLHQAVQVLRNDKRKLQITIYSGHVIKDLLGDKTDPFLLDTSLWLAQYTTKPTWPKGTWPTWSLWQYSDQGSVPGVGGSSVDLNMFNGSAENCVKWFGPPEDVVAEPPALDMVSINISAPDGIGFTVTVNGKAYHA